MRTVIAASLGLILAVCPTLALAESDLPPGAGELFMCGTVFSLHAGDLMAQGDEAGADDYHHLGDALTERGVATLEAFGYAPEEIDEIAWDIATNEGFRFGDGEAEQMLADCLAAQSSP